MALALIQFLVSLVNVLASHYVPEGESSQSPLVSVLIPARNEEKAIGYILSDLMQLSYQNLEILVYNDESSDRTEEVIRTFMMKDKRISLVPAVTLPQNWTGKNHACHQLALQAKGNFYLFLDADVRVGGSLIRNTIYWLIKKDLALISIFPVQIMKSFGEQASVPLMNWILLSLLPLPLISRSRRPSLSAANGQFMLFQASIYNRFHLHELFKNHTVEDVAIIRFLKKNGHCVDTFLGKGNVSCRMYESLGQAIEGFTKNIFLFFGNSMVVTILYALLITIAPFIVVLYLPSYGGIALAACIIMMRVNISIASRQSVYKNLLYIVPQHIVFLLIIGKGIYNRITGTLEWKGRNVLNT